MNTLCDDLQNIIYEYKHQMTFRALINELNEIVDFWCDQQLTSRYCKCRHIDIYNKCRNDFICLNDYEEHLFINFDYFDL
jgi:hypothetical protein